MNDQNKSKRQSFFGVAIAGWDHRNCLAGDKLQQDIVKWLSPPDYLKNHHIACESRHSGSAEWFIQGNTFAEWKSSEAPSSTLWIHGKRPSIPNSYAFAETKIFLFRSWSREKRILVRQTFDLSI